MHVARACTSQQHSGGDTVKAYCQRLGLKLKTSLQQALNFIANFFFLLTQRLHASGSGCVEEAQQGVSGDDVLPGVHHEVVSSDPLTKPCPAPGYHPIAVNITAFGWPWGLDVLSTQVLV